MPCVPARRLILVLLLSVLGRFQLLAQLQADFSVNKTGGCSPLSINFTNKTSGASASAIYTWDLGNGNSSYEVNPAAVYRVEKTYTVKLTVVDGNKTSSKSQTITVYKRPTIAIATDISKGCAPLSVNLSSIVTPGDGMTQSYFWDYGDGQTEGSGTLTQVKHTYSFAQQVAVSLTVTNSYGCQLTVTKDSLINVLPVLDASFKANQTTICKVSDPVSFTNLSTGPGTLSYSWDFGDGSTSSQINPSHAFNKKGNYDVSLKVNSSEGCTVTKNVSSYLNVANFQSDVIAPSLYCTGSEIKFTNKSTPDPFMTDWYVEGLGNGYTYGQSYSLFYIYNAGAYRFRMINTFGTCKDTLYKDFIVNKSPKLDGFLMDKPSFCSLPASINFKDTSLEAVKWKWNYNCSYNCPTADDTVQAPSHTYTYPTNYYVYLTVTNKEGCSSGVLQALDLSIPQILIDINYTNSNWSHGCVGLDLSFKVNHPELIDQYKWTFSDDSSTSNAIIPEHVFNKVGIHKVTLNYVLKNGCKGTATYDDIRVRTKPKFDFTIPSGTEICGNTPVRLVGTSNENIDWYWFFGDGGTKYTYNWNQDYGDHQYQTEGFYTITVIGQSDGCLDTLTKVNCLHVNPPFPKIAGYSNTCDGTRGEVTFSDGSKQVTGWKWDFGDGASTSYTTSQSGTKHTYAKSGYYNVVLTTTNGSCAVKDSMITYVLLKQNPVLNAAQTDLCSDKNIPITIDHLDRNYGAYYDWDQYNIHAFEYGGGRPANIFIYSTTGYNLGPNMAFNASQFERGKNDFRIILQSDHFGCLDTTNYISINVKGPIANYSVKTDFCSKQNVTFIDSSKSTGNIPISTWNWSFGDGASASNTSATPFVHSYSNPGSYSVTLTVTDAQGCTDQKWVPYMLVGGVRAAFTTSATTVSPNTSISFYNNTFDNYTQNTSYQWIFGDGTTSAETNPQHTYSIPGTYTVMLLAKSLTYGCTDTAKQVIIVKYINSAFSINTSYISSSSCPPVLVHFTNTSSNASKVTWEFGDGARSENVFNPTHLYTKPGTYIITLHAFSDNGTEYITSDSVVIKSTTVTILSDKFMSCTAQSISFNAPGKLSPTYVWDFGDGVMKQTKDSFSTHGFSAAGVYAPSLLVTDAEGCTSAATLANKIIIDSLQINIGNIPSACNSSLVYFQPVVNSVAADQAQQVLHYLWDFGTGNIIDTSNLKSPSFTYTKPGSFLVHFLVESPAGCKKETTKQVVVDEKIKGSIAGPDDICEKTNAQFTSTAAGSNVSFEWNFGQGNTSTQQNPSAQLFTNPGNYNIALMVKNGACIDTTYHLLNVHSNPKIDLSQSGLILCLGNSVQLSASGADAYNWQPKTGLNDNTIANPLATPTITTTYTLEAQSLFGCKSTDSVKITVSQPIHLQVNRDTVICKGSSLQLNASGAYSYQWINNTKDLNNIAIANPLASPTMTTTYTVQGSDQYNCFIDKASINVTVAALPTVNAGPDMILSGGTSYQFLPIYSNDVVKWAWSPGDYLSCTNCSSPIATPVGDMTYIISVKNAYNCLASDTVKIATECGQSHIYIPDAFTPNGDGFNSTFSIKGSGVRLVKSIGIYNRWGELIFSRKNFLLNDASAAWDGKYKGLTVPVGSYVYIAEFQCASGEIFTRKGTITVVY
jgi:gliding motility-associated-like protein